jgi:exodeoxyribonuclease I
LDIGNDEIQRWAQLVLENDAFRTRVREAISKRYPPQEPSAYVEERIYDGFPSRPDELLMQQFHRAPWEQRAGILDQAEDLRIRELGYRLIYTERPALLSEKKRTELDAWHGQRLRPNFEVPWLTISGALDEVERELAEGNDDRDFAFEVKSWLETVSP